MAIKFKRIYIEITNACNLNCAFCAGTKRRRAFMSAEAFSHILKEIKPFSDYIYLHVLGEPLLHPELQELLRLGGQAGFFINLTTNGTLLPQRMSDLDHYIRQCNISLHSFDEASGVHHQRYVQECLSCGDQLAERGTYVSYRLWNGQNGRLSPQGQRMAEQLAQHYHVLLSQAPKQKLASRRFLHVADSFVWPSPTLPRQGSIGTCYGLRSHCAILCDGSVVPCCLDGEGIMTLGNIFTTPFAQLLEQERALRIRHGFQNGRVIEPLCQRCSYRLRFS